MDWLRTAGQEIKNVGNSITDYRTNNYNREMEEDRQTRAIDEMVRKRQEAILTRQLDEQNRAQRLKIDQERLAMSQNSMEQKRQELESKKAEEQSNRDRINAFNSELVNLESDPNRKIGFEDANRIAIRHGVNTSPQVRQYLSTLRPVYTQEQNRNFRAAEADKNRNFKDVESKENRDHRMSMLKARLAHSDANKTKLIVNTPYEAQTASEMLTELYAQLSQFNSPKFVETGEASSKRGAIHRQISKIQDGLAAYNIKGGNIEGGYPQMPPIEGAKPTQKQVEWTKSQVMPFIQQAQQLFPGDVAKQKMYISNKIGADTSMVVITED